MRTGATAAVCLSLACVSVRPRQLDPPRELHVATGDAVLPVRVVGGGDPAAETIVALQGGPGITAEYLRVLEPLASPTLRLVIYDQRGSPRVTVGTTRPEAWSRATAANDLLAVIDAVGAHRAHLLGHSWGGLAMQAFAEAHPDRVASLIFVDAVPPTSAALGRGGAARAAKLAHMQAAGLVPMKLPSPTEDCREAILATSSVMLADPVHPPAALASAVEGCSWKDAPAVLSQGSEYDYRAALGRLAVPVLVMMGDKDPVDAGWADETQRALSRAQVLRVTVQNCGHFPFWEQPPTFFSEVRSFLARAPRH